MSSVDKENIPREQAVPVLCSDIFDGHEDKRFAMISFSGDEAIAGSHEEGTLINAYFKLRANVYVDQTDMLSKEQKVDGIEVDSNDERSRHILVAERRLGKVAVVSCMRLINKESEDDLLPVELDFPDYFSLTPAPVDSVEVSRFISKLNSIKANLEAEKNMIAAGLSGIVDNDGGAYAIVEPKFERTLNRLLKIKTKRLSELAIETYNDYNVGIEIDKAALTQRFGREVLDRYNSQDRVYYWGECKEDDRKASQS